MGWGGNVPQDKRACTGRISMYVPLLLDAVGTTRYMYLLLLRRPCLRADQSTGFLGDNLIECEVVHATAKVGPVILRCYVSVDAIRVS